MSSDSGILRAPAILLLADPDRVSQRFIEMALSRSPSRSWLVEPVQSGAAARDYLERRVVDLIVSDTELPDMNANQLHRQLAEASQLSRIPFFLFSADGRATTKQVAFAAGVDDYLVKPCDPLELVARADALVLRERRLRLLLRRKNYTLAGDLATFAFPDLVGMLEMLKRTGVLAVATSRAQGQVFFKDGQIVHAILGNVTGERAFYQLMAHPDGMFEFVPEAVRVTRTIDERASGLLIEGARLIDTERSDGETIDMLANLRSAEGAKRAPARAGRVASPRPQPPLVVAFAEGLKDPFAVGDIRYFDKPELEGWTRSPIGRDRLHILLVADIRAGIASLLPLAGSPGERFVHGGLLDQPKILGIGFHLREERVLDVLLLDIKNPAAFQNDLLRQPCVIIVAPPDGDFLAIGTRGRAELDGLIAALVPHVVLCVGNALSKGHLAELPSLRDGGTRLRSERGVMGSRDVDLRQLLIDAIDVWGEAEDDRA